MKNAVRALTLLAVALLIPALASGQALELPGRDSSSPRTSPNGLSGQTIGTNDVLISYGRPSVNERDVFGGLQKFGEVWRAGANEATAIVNSQAKIWGTRHDAANDVLRVTVDSREGSHSEMLSYRFDDVTASSATVVLHWATTEVPFTISFGQ